jgi:hypothetical protein
MKKFSLVFISLLFICSTMDAQSKTEKAIAAAVEKLRLAMISGNRKGPGKYRDG